MLQSYTAIGGYEPAGKSKFGMMLQPNIFKRSRITPDKSVDRDVMGNPEPPCPPSPPPSPKKKLNKKLKMRQKKQLNLFVNGK